MVMEQKTPTAEHGSEPPQDKGPLDNDTIEKNSVDSQMPPWLCCIQNSQQSAHAQKTLMLLALLSAGGGAQGAFAIRTSNVSDC